MICKLCKVTPRIRDESAEAVVYEYDIEYCNLHNSVYALEIAKLIAESPRIQDVMAGDVSVDVNGREIAVDIQKLIGAIRQGIQAI